MKKFNLSLISIFVTILLPLLAISATSAWATTYYVDAVNGNDTTGAPDNSSLPFKTIAKINTFFQAGTIVHGDYIKFKKGTTPTEQVFRENCIDLANCSGSSGAPITITSYGDGSYKPVIISAKTITNHSGVGWTGPDANGVYRWSTTTLPQANVFEDDVPLVGAASSAVTTGQFYWDRSASPYKLYYKPTSGTPSAHLITASTYGTAVAVGWPHANSYITVDGLKFQGEGINNTAFYGSMSNWTIQNCDFLFEGVALWHNTEGTCYWSDITVQNCTFDYCETSSMSFEGGGTVGLSFLRLNLLNNKITHNNLLPSGQPWPYPFPDADCIAIQNMKDSKIIGNDMSGWISTPFMNPVYPVNGGITVWIGAGSGPLVIDNVTNDGTGKIKVSAHFTDNGPWLVTGQRVALWGISDSALGTATTGTWTVTVNDASSFVLNGSTFPTGHTYTAGSGAGRQEPNLPQSGNVIAKNYIHDLTGYPSHGICGTMNTGYNYVTDHSIQIYENIIARLATTAGYQACAGVSCSGTQASSKSLAANNTITGVDQGLFISGGNWTIKNNIVSNVTDRYMVYNVGGGLPANDVDYNCYDSAGTSAKFWWGPGSTQSLNISGWRSASGWDAHAITTNPLLTNQSGAFSLPLDFQLQTSSPCINAGANVGLTSDFWANPIPAPPSPVDVGVHQIPATSPPPAPACTYSISPTTQAFTSAGGSGSIQVTSVSNCNWTAATNASWITITAGTGGIGNGQVTFAVASNTATTARTGAITVAGQQFSVTQAGASAPAPTPTPTYSISPTSNSFSASGGSGAIIVTASTGAAWTAVDNASWITITSGQSGTGSGTVSYTVARNSSRFSRTGVITVAGQKFSVTQAGSKWLWSW